MDENQVKIYSPAISKPVNIAFISDSHLIREDERGAPYAENRARMEKAFQQPKHHKTNEVSNVEAFFDSALEKARKGNADLIILGGDIFSYPSAAAVDWVHERMQKLGIPWVYVAGNHDWHYEGLEGSLHELRSSWIQKRLLPLYQSRDPMGCRLDVQDLQVLVIDNSLYEILPEQLQLLQDQIASNRPFILSMHIPLYAPGRGILFGCGNPEWGAAKDNSYKTERRQPWPERHTQVTMDFHRAVFNAPNLLGVFVGHIHRQSIDIINGIPQVVSTACARGDLTHIKILPLTKQS